MTTRRLGSASYVYMMTPTFAIQKLQESASVSIYMCPTRFLENVYNIQMLGQSYKTQLQNC
jgi:tryptophanase